MPNANTSLDRLVGAPSPAQGTKAVPSLALGSNTETLFTNQLAATAILNPVNPSWLSGAAAAPSFGVNLDGFAFRVRATFKVTTGGTSTAIIAIYSGSTITAGNKVATITSQSLVTTSDSGFLEATLIWDSVSQKLKGIQQGQFGTTIVTPAILTGSSGSIAITTQAGLTFCCTANLGSNVTGSTFVLTEFAAEVV